MAKDSDIIGPGDPLENMKKLFKLVDYTHAFQIDTELEESREELDRSAKNVADFLELELVRPESGMTDLGSTRDIYAKSNADLDAVTSNAERLEEGWPGNPPGSVRFRTPSHMVWAA